MPCGRALCGNGRWSLPCLVHYVLCFRVASSPRLSGDRRQESSPSLAGPATLRSAGLSASDLSTVFERGFFETGILSPPLVPISYRPELWADHPMLGDDPRHGWLADVVEARHLGAGLPAGDDAFGDFAPFGGVELLASTADTSLGPGGGDAGRGPLPDHGALELGERADHLHHHAAGRGGGVDVLGDRPEAGARLGDPLHDVQHVLQRAGQPVELPDDDRVAFAQMVQHAVQLGPVPTPAGGGLLEHAPAAGGSERFGLQGVVLLVALGDAGIAEQQRRCWQAWASFTNDRLRMDLAGTANSSAIFLSISSFRIASKGKPFMNGSSRHRNEAVMPRSHPAVFRATNPVVRHPDRSRRDGPPLCARRRRPGARPDEAALGQPAGICRPAMPPPVSRPGHGTGRATAGGR